MTDFPPTVRDRIRRGRVGRERRARLTEAVERLVQLYDAWGKPDEAVRWFQEQETLKKSEAKLAVPASDSSR